MISIRKVRTSTSWWAQWAVTCPGCHDVTVKFYMWHEAMRWADEHARAHLGWSRFQPQNMPTYWKGAVK